MIRLPLTSQVRSCLLLLLLTYLAPEASGQAVRGLVLTVSGACEFRSGKDETWKPLEAGQAVAGGFELKCAEGGLASFKYGSAEERLVRGGRSPVKLPHVQPSEPGPKQKPGGVFGMGPEATFATQQLAAMQAASHSDRSMLLKVLLSTTTFASGPESRSTPPKEDELARRLALSQSVSATEKSEPVLACLYRLRDVRPAVCAKVECQSEPTGAPDICRVMTAPQPASLGAPGPTRAVPDSFVGGTR